MNAVRQGRIAGMTAAAIVVASCFGRSQVPEAAPSQPVRDTVTVLSRLSEGPASIGPVPAPTESSEPFVDLEMVDAPVKLILQRLADIGGLQLILPPELNKTISVQYIHVPVSVALTDVLKRANLRLGVGPAPNLPFDTVTVFYRLPANVDSMSADAIMRRFGVTRAMAELIVKSRRP